MTRAWPLAISLAGCFSPTAPAGAPCASDSSCPSGLTCIADVCVHPGETMIDAAALDGPIDGAVDAMPDGSLPTGPDEDVDGIADEQDRCPAVANASQTDIDGDGVGDACDPHPELAGDHRVVFDGFNGGLPPGWTQSGPWTPGQGAVGTTVVATERSMLLPPTAAPTKVQLTTRLTPSDQLGTTSRGIGLTAPADAADLATGIVCELAYVNTNPTPFLALVDLSICNTFKTGAYNWALGSTYTLVMTRDGDRYTCAVDGPEGPLSISGMRPTSIALPRMGLRASSTPGTFDYLEIITSD